MTLVSGVTERQPLPRYATGVTRKRNPVPPVAETASTPAAAPGWLTVLGLADPKDRDWARVRGAQLAAVRSLAVANLMSTLGSIAVVAFTLLGHVAQVQLIAWMTGAGTLAALSAWGKFSKRAAGEQDATRAALLKESVWAVSSGCAWAVPLQLFAPHLGLAELLVLWTIVTALMASAAFAMSSIPLATTWRPSSSGRPSGWRGTGR